MSSHRTCLTAVLLLLLPACPDEGNAAPSPVGAWDVTVWASPSCSGAPYSRFVISLEEGGTGLAEINELLLAGWVQNGTDVDFTLYDNGAAVIVYRGEFINDDKLAGYALAPNGANCWEAVRLSTAR